MTDRQRQWLNARQNLVDWNTYDLIKSDSVGAASADNSSEASLMAAFQQMLVDKKDLAALPGPTLAPSMPAAVHADTAFLALHQETNIEKILWGWPEKNNLKFCGMIGKDLNEWLLTVEILLGDRQVHPGICHIMAGCRLSGKLFNDWIKAGSNNTRPNNWAGFKLWLVARAPLGPTLAQITDELDDLKQGPNETCQEFYERFRDWQQKAKSLNFGHDEITCFVKQLSQGGRL
ncbi:uncharacterized protein VP01_1642g4 [Puccinia sorghi]|uniref:Retrotransposon gag domain-containing protein n=1 Tax=Puccinia sorghi TaxID=27349 RepID=A0A0L6VGS1_9BASI|nr:uncharacterized protein VP01_1642g4 [Puccinia sorghi]